MIWQLKYLYPTDCACGVDVGIYIMQKIGFIKTNISSEMGGGLAIQYY